MESQDPQKMMELLQEQLIDAKEELRTIIPTLRTGEKTRLMMSMIEYPVGNVKEFPHEESLQKALSAWKRSHDVQVALGVHATLEGYVVAKERAVRTEAAEKLKAEGVITTEEEYNEIIRTGILPEKEATHE